MPHEPAYYPGRFAPRLAHAASPLSVVRNPAFESVRAARLRPAQSVRGLASAAGGRRVMVRHSRSRHTLCFYITPHFAKCSPVAALKLRFVPPTASRPLGFAKQALCKVPYARQRSSQPSALPDRCAPTRYRLCALVLVWLRVVGSGASRSVLVSGLRPVMGVVLPRPPAGPRRCAALAPRRLPVRPPGGSLQSGAGAMGYKVRFRRQAPERETHCRQTQTHPVPNCHLGSLTCTTPFNNACSCCCTKTSTGESARHQLHWRWLRYLYW